MRQGITRREMLLGNLVGLLGGIVALLLGPRLWRGRAAPSCPAPQAPAEHAHYYGYTHDPLNQVTTYTYDAGGRLRCVEDPKLVTTTTYFYIGDNGWRLPQGEGEA